MNPLLLRRRCMAHEADVDYSKQYLTFVSLADGNNIKFFTNDDNNTRTIYVSTDKNTWAYKTSSSAGTTLATLNNGGKLYVKLSVNLTGYSNGTFYNYFEATGDFALEGNIMSLLYSDKFWERTSLPNYYYTFYRMFYNCARLADISNLVMPATTLVHGCYERMFQGSGITSLPKNLLPATTLAENCYYSMFSYTGITTLPSGLLPATALASSCYRQMFYGCASLVTVASDLMSATTLASACCRAMFSACSSLQNSPDLNANTLVTDCYRSMFNACTSITYIKCTATSISASNATNAWLVGASSRGTFVRASGVSWPRSTSGVPSGWTIQNA